MSKPKKDPLLEALQEGRSYTWTVPDGGDLASMRAAIKHGQTLTMSPIENPRDIQVGDLVFVKWHQGNIFHIVGEVQGDHFLIVNSLGKVNGWVGAKEILGKITNIIEPEPRPSVPSMLEELRTAYNKLTQYEQFVEEDAKRLLSIVDDLVWYADRIGKERWDKMPRSNKWSFEQNLWQLTKQAKRGFIPELHHDLRFFVDAGKQCVGLAGELLILLEEGKAE